MAIPCHRATHAIVPPMRMLVPPGSRAPWRHPECTPGHRPPVPHPPWQPGSVRQGGIKTSTHRRRGAVAARVVVVWIRARCEGSSVGSTRFLPWCGMPPKLLPPGHLPHDPRQVLDQNLPEAWGFQLQLSHNGAHNLVMSCREAFASADKVRGLQLLQWFTR